MPYGTRSSYKAPWTEEEDQALWKALKQYGVKYADIQQNVPRLSQRSVKAIEVRAARVRTCARCRAPGFPLTCPRSLLVRQLHAQLISASEPWTKADDELLTQLLAQVGNRIRKIVKMNAFSKFRSSLAIKVRPLRSSGAPWLAATPDIA